MCIGNVLDNKQINAYCYQTGQQCFFQHRRHTHRMQVELNQSISVHIPSKCRVHCVPHLRMARMYALDCGAGGCVPACARGGGGHMGVDL